MASGSSSGVGKDIRKLIEKAGETVEWPIQALRNCFKMLEDDSQAKGNKLEDLERRIGDEELFSKKMIEALQEIISHLQISLENKNFKGFKGFKGFKDATIEEHRAALRIKELAIEAKDDTIENLQEYIGILECFLSKNQVILESAIQELKAAIAQKNATMQNLELVMETLQGKLGRACTSTEDFNKIIKDLFKDVRTLSFENREMREVADNERRIATARNTGITWFCVLSFALIAVWLRDIDKPDIFG